MKNGLFKTIINSIFYIIILLFFIAFIRVIFGVYKGFFNESGENIMLNIKQLEDEINASNCKINFNELDNFYHNGIVTLDTIKICEEELLFLISNSIINSKAKKKFLRLSKEDTKSFEVKKDFDSLQFNIHTINVKVVRDYNNESKQKQTVKVILKNLNKNVHNPL